MFFQIQLSYVESELAHIQNISVGNERVCKTNRTELKHIKSGRNSYIIYVDFL